jgi:hypothetical protein
MTLDDIGLKHGTDKASNGHDYLRIYQEYFATIRDTAVKIGEIGIAGGNSLRTWAEYFTTCQIFGLDHTEAYVKATQGLSITTIFGDASDRETWSRIKKDHGGDFDVWIDDGAHTPYAVFMALMYGFPLLRPGGLWFIEDTHASYLDEYRRDNQRNPADIDLCDLHVNGLIHDMSNWRLHENGKNQCGKWSGQSDVSVPPWEWVHYYKSLIVIKKRVI